MKTFAVYGIGAALVDTEIEVSDEELNAMQVEKGLMTLVDEARQAELIDHLGDHMVRASHSSGGSAGNSMIATALFGGPTFMTCKVANDADGDIYLADLEASGVDHNLKQGRGEGTSGKCLVLITPDAERSMNTFLGVSETLSVAELDEQAIADSEWVYLEGYLVTSTTGHPAAVRTRELAEAAGVKTSVSFSDPGMVTYFRDNMAAMVGDGVDLIFCNEAEALEWGKTESLDAALDAIKKVAKSCVITLGARGAMYWDGDERGQVDAPAIEAVDTNGAGDMFAGAFLYSLHRGESFRRATEFAVKAAGEVVQSFGPRLTAEAYRELKRNFYGAAD